MAVADALLRTYSPRGPRRDPSTEATFLHTTARACHWRLGREVQERLHRTYAWITSDYRDRTTFILLQTGGVVAAFTEADPSEHVDFSFVDRPDFVQAAASVLWPIHFLTGAELAQDLTREDLDFLRNLDKGMAYDINRWNPQTVGDVIFNWWD